MPPGLILGLIGLFTFLGIAFALLGIFGRTESANSTSWPAVTGKITSSQLREVRNKPRRLPYEIVSYTVDVTYTYTVGGQLYESDKLVLMDNLWEQNSAQRRAAKYVVGWSHPVYYNPTNLSRAVLEPGDTSEGDSARVHSILGIWLPIGMVPLVLLFLSAYAIIWRDTRRVI